MSWPLLARDQELSQVHQLLDAGTAVVLHGPIGVGKTTILAEAIGRLTSPKRPAIWAHATDSTATIPLSPFANLLPPAPSANPAAMLRSVIDEMERRSRADGLLLAIDDAQLLDDASLSLVGLLLTQPWARVAMTVRTGDDLNATVRAITQHPSVERIELGPLDRETTTAVLQTALGQLHPDLDEELWQVTQGNPLLVRELVEHPAGRFEPNDAGAWVRVGPLLSPRLTDLVRERMEHIDDEQRAALEVVAAAAPAPYAIIESALGHDVLSGLEHDGLVSVTGTGDAAVVRPAHPIHGEILVAHTADRRRRTAYRRAAVAVTGFEHLVDPLRAAVWQLRSGITDDPKRAIDGAMIALGRHDPALAEAMLVPLVTEQPSTSIAIPLGRALGFQGRTSDAEEVFASAVADDDSETTELASARAFNLAFGLGRVDDAIAVLAHARTQVAAGSLRSRLDADQGVIAGLVGDFQLAIRAAEAALAAPDASAPTKTSAHVSLTLAHAMLGRCADYDRLAADAVAAASATGDQLPFARAQILIMHAHALMAAGRFDDAVDVATTELSAAEPDELTRTPWLGTLAIALAQQGRVAAAAEQVHAAQAAARIADPFALERQSNAMERWCAGLSGVPATPNDDGPDPDVRIQVWAGRADAWGMAAGGDVAGAAKRASETGSAAIAAQHITWGSMALHDAVRFGVPELVVDELAAVSALTTGADFIVAQADHARALADRSVPALLALVDTFARHGCPLLAAEVAAQVASIEASNGRSIEAARAVAASMTWEAVWNAPTTPALRARPALLGEREWQVGAEAAAGSTSREIAERQFISVRTVDNHLGSIYRKLGLDGRSDLADHFLVGVTDS